MENVSNTSAKIVSNAISACKGIRGTNVSRLLHGHLNIITLRNKFSFLCEQMKGYIDIFMLSESKLEDSVPLSQFLIDGFHAPFIFGCDRNRGEIMLIISERTF